MADATLTLDAEINTSDWNAGVKDIESGSEQIEDAAKKASEAVEDVDKKSKKSSKGFEGFGVTAGAVGGLVSQGVGMAVDAIANLTGDIVEASDSADKFRSTLDFAGLDTSTIDALTASTQKYADQTVYSISDIRNVTAQLAANGVQGFDKLAEAAGNLNAVAGGNAETFGSVGMVLTQTAGAGKLTTENWNQLADAIPGASGKLQEAMLKNGAYTGNFRDAMEKGEISAEEFNKAILDLGMTDAAQEAATSTATIEGAMGNLEASVVGVGSTILDQFKGPLTSGISMLAQGISGLSGVFTGLVQTIGPILSQIGTVFQTAFAPIGTMITTQLLPALQPLMTALQNLGNAVMPVIMTAIQTIAPVLATVVSNVIQTMTVISTAVTPVINGIASVIQAVLPAIQTAFQIWGTYIQGVINAVFPFIQTVIETVMNVISSIISTILALVQGDWDGVWNGIKNIAQSVWDGIGNIIQAGVDLIKNLIDNALNFIKGIFQSIWNAIKGTVQDVWNGIKSAISSAINAVSSTISSVLSSIQNFFSNAWNSIRNAVSSAWSGITSAVSNGVSSMMSFISSIPGRIMGFFSSAGSWLLSAGRNIIQGLINGITGAIGGAISAVKNAVGGIISGAKSLLGIHSPSTVFRDEIGGMIPPGLSEGVERKTPQAVDSVETMARKIVDAGNVKISGVISNTEPANMVGTGNGLSRDVLVAAFAEALAKLPQVRVFSDPADAAAWVGNAIDRQLATQAKRRKVFQ